jgi:hypothetical protein
MATEWPSTELRARHTSAIPPSPNFPSSTYCPISVPTLGLSMRVVLGSFLVADLSKWSSYWTVTDLPFTKITFVPFA